MKDVLNHKLAPVPLSLYHLDSRMCTTKKSTLLKELEACAETNISSSVKVVNI